MLSHISSGLGFDCQSNSHSRLYSNTSFFFNFTERWKEEYWVHSTLMPSTSSGTTNTHTASWPLEPTRVTYGKFQVHGFIWLASHQFLSGWQLRALPPQVQSTDQGFHRKQADSFQHKAFLSSLTWQLPRKQCCEKEDPGRSKSLWSSRPDVNSYS